MANGQKARQPHDQQCRWTFFCTVREQTMIDHHLRKVGLQLHLTSVWQNPIQSHMCLAKPEHTTQRLNSDKVSHCSSKHDHHFTHSQYFLCALGGMKRTCKDSSKSSQGTGPIWLPTDTNCSVFIPWNSVYSRLNSGSVKSINQHLWTNKFLLQTWCSHFSTCNKPLTPKLNKWKRLTNPAVSGHYLSPLHWVQVEDC
jgi:hypothetical protein